MDRQGYTYHIYPFGLYLSWRLVVADRLHPMLILRDIYRGDISNCFIDKETELVLNVKGSIIYVAIDVSNGMSDSQL